MKFGRIVLMGTLMVLAAGCAPKADFTDGLFSWVREIRVALGRLENRQVPITQVNFIPPSQFDANKSDDTDVSIYSKTIGSLPFRETIGKAQIVYSFVTGVAVAGVGPGDQPVLMLFVDQLDQDVCRKINKQKEISPVDVELPNTFDFTKLGGSEFDALVTMGQAEYTTIEKSGATTAFTLGDDTSVPGSAPLKGHKEGCFFDPSIKSYRFYAVLSGV